MTFIIFVIILYFVLKYRHALVAIFLPLLILAILVGLFGPFFIGLIIVLLVLAALFNMYK